MLSFWMQIPFLLTYPQEETTEICTNELFKESEIVLSLATKDLHFIFD